VLFYSAGHFFSREGIGPGMLTWHPQGIHHGPHPRAAEAARGQTGTDEVAVMVDTARPLRATAAAAGVEQEGYWGTWR
jgi:homogentisate 1,2-dioxygenase